MSEQFKGILAMVLACSIWGLSPMFYKALAEVPPLEILSHRTVWSFIFFLIVLFFQRRVGEFVTLAKSPRAMGIVAVASLMIAINWGLFIYSIQVGRAVESSLGYYIFPLVAVLLGAVFFAERLSAWQWVAVSIAAIAVMTLTYGLGVVPVISLILAITFGFYGVIKKQLTAGPVISVAAEVFILLPLALVWLWGVHFAAWTGPTGRNFAGFGQDAWLSFLLVLAGPITGLPLMLFSYASRRVNYSTIGLVQYLNPTLQGLVAVFVLGEVFTGWHIIAFALIWVALAIYSVEAFRDRHHTPQTPIAPNPVPLARR